MAPLARFSPFRGLVFNQSWEDPVIDREALEILPDTDTVLTITSGGCSALNLLCLRPRKLLAVDANPAQSHLLELKLAAIRVLDYDDFLSLFGSPKPASAGSIYRTKLRRQLPADARRYWDRNVHLVERGLITQGKLGFFLAWLRRYLRLQLGERRLRRFFEARTLEEQRRLYYDEIHPLLWRGPALRVLRTRQVLTLAGMPRSQFDLIEGHEGIEDYMRDRVASVLTTVPIRDNYFVALAAFGSYIDRESVPPYLLERNFGTLKAMVERLESVTAPLHQHLKTLPAQSIDKFNLMDIFDWMDRETRHSTLSETIRTGVEGGRFIYRSTINSLPVPPDFEHAVTGEPELAQRLFAGDRALTYSSFYVYRFTRNETSRQPEAAPERTTLRRS